MGIFVFCILWPIKKSRNGIVLAPFGCLGTIPILTSYTLFSVDSRAVAQTCCYYRLKGGF